MDLKTKIMAVKYVIMLCIIVLKTDGGSGTQLTFAIDDSIPYNMLITESRFISYKLSSSIHCAVECQLWEKCIMFGYTAAINTCQLYDDEITDQNKHVFISVNVTYYKAWCTDMKGYLYYRTLDKCLFRQREKMIYGAAVADCVINGGSLFEPRSVNELQHFVQYDPSRFWIGGNGVFATKTWHWISGGEIQGDSDLWASGEPDSDFANLCMEVRPRKKRSIGGYYRYNDRHCDSTRQFYCQLI